MTNKFRYLSEDIIEILLIDGIHKTIIDSSSLSAISEYRIWSISDGGYARSSSHGTSESMSRVIYGGCNLWVDHDSGDKMDNRSVNLRESTPSQNGFNKQTPSNSSSGYKGVHKCSRAGDWHAFIKKDYISINLGQYSCIRDAATAYRYASFYLFGEFTRVNSLISDSDMSDIGRIDVINRIHEFWGDYSGVTTPRSVNSRKNGKFYSRIKFGNRSVNFKMVSCEFRAWSMYEYAKYLKDSKYTHFPKAMPPISIEDARHVRLKLGLGKF
jgi:hypothetical protein